MWLNPEALAVFRKRNIMVAFAWHVMHVLQPIDMARAARFPSHFRDALRR
jgi:hypothetical protein